MAMTSSNASSESPKTPTLLPALTWPRPARSRTAILVAATLASAAVGAYFGVLVSGRAQERVATGPKYAPQTPILSPAPEHSAPAVVPVVETSSVEAKLEAALVFHAMGPKLALGHVPQEALVGEARRVESAEGGELLLVRDIDEDALGVDTAGLVGMEVELYDQHGPRCRAKIESLAATQHFYGEWLEGEAEEMWGWHDEQTALTAYLKPLVGDCEDAVFARQASLVAPAIATQKVARGALRTKAYSAFRDLPRYQELQRAYLAFDPENSGRWDRSYYEKPSVRIYQGASERLVVVSAMVGGCGEFEADLSVAFRVGENGALEAFPLAGGEQGAEVVVALDIDRDGTLELVTRDRWNERAIRVKSGGDYREDLSHSGTFMGCHC